MGFQAFLAGLRQRLGHFWLVLVFGAVYALSQIIIGIQLEQIGGPGMLALQVQTFTAEGYLATFRDWQAEGLMPFYRSHLIFDSIHWLWYAIALCALIAWLLQRRRRPASWNAVLVLPLVAGLCDLLENTLQHVFLSDPDFVTVVDPLPAISATASLLKWGLVLVSVAVIAVLAAGGRTEQ